MDIDINQRNYDNYEDIDGKPHKRVILSSNSGNLINPATSDKQDTILTELQQKTEPTDIQLGELIPVLRTLILALTNPPYIDKSANAIRKQ